MAPLVEYSSDSDSSSPSRSSSPPPPKKARLASTSSSISPPSLPPSALPPLPASFHDLYASATRPAPADDPSLHHGRRRQVAHIAGRWPSHVYAEWRPFPPAHGALEALIATLQRETENDGRHSSSGGTGAEPPDDDGGEEEKEDKDDKAQATGTGAGGHRHVIHSLLTSDLGVPLPLHVSLSRPLSLPTADKDAFLERVRGALLRAVPRGHGDGSGSASGGGRTVRPFVLACRGVDWHRTHESGRSFLVLRVASLCAPDGDGAGGDEENRNNPELAALLRQCNAVARELGQPELYQWAEGDSGSRGAENNNNTSNSNSNSNSNTHVGDAFHVSLAWSFAVPTESLRRRTWDVFRQPEIAAVMRAVRIPVDGVKVKIGNVVTHLPLAGEERKLDAVSGLFGM